MSDHKNPKIPFRERFDYQAQTIILTTRKDVIAGPDRGE